jgi:hypothetical protein
MNRLKEDASLKEKQDDRKSSFIIAVEYGNVNITVTVLTLLVDAANPYIKTS